MARVSKLGKLFYTSIEDAPDHCVEWPGYRDKDGYGRYSPPGLNQIGAHTWQIKLLGLTINIDQVVAHTCDNPACFNPKHLYVGTQKKNQQDMLERNRLGLRKGETNNQATLSDAEVSEIRSVYTGARGELTALGKRYNTSRVTIRNIVKGIYRNG